jgi:hypothetical protein
MKWIKCNKNSPGDNEPEIVMFYDGISIGFATCRGYEDDENIEGIRTFYGVFSDSWSPGVIRASHWMLLPEPPKEDE